METIKPPFVFDIYDHIIEIQKNQLINDFKVKYKNYNIDDYIIESVNKIINSDIDFSKIEEYVPKIKVPKIKKIVETYEEDFTNIFKNTFNGFYNLEEQSKKNWMNDAFKNYKGRLKKSLDNKEDNYNTILFNHIIQIYKDINSDIVNSMPLKKSQDKFTRTYDNIFDKYTDGSVKWRVKKNDLKERYNKDELISPNNRFDYQLIMFKYIIDLEERLKYYN